LGQDLNRPLLQFVAGVSVTLGHNDAVMAEKGPHGFDINPALDESRGERVPKVMEAQSRDADLTSPPSMHQPLSELSNKKSLWSRRPVA
jgi:hypothetical protein